MFRRIVIILASAMATLTLAAVPADAGAGWLELYSSPGYSGTHVGIPPGDLDDYVNMCVSVTTLTATVLTEAQSAENSSNHDLDLYHGASGCVGPNYIGMLTINTQWTMIFGEPVTYVFVRP
jgi:hypothetical protein